MDRRAKQLQQHRQYLSDWRRQDARWGVYANLMLSEFLLEPEPEFKRMAIDRIDAHFEKLAISDAYFKTMTFQERADHLDAYFRKHSNG